MFNNSRDNSLKKHSVTFNFQVLFQTQKIKDSCFFYFFLLGIHDILKICTYFSVSVFTFSSSLCLHELKTICTTVTMLEKSHSYSFLFSKSIYSLHRFSSAKTLYIRSILDKFDEAQEFKSAFVDSVVNL